MKMLLISLLLVSLLVSGCTFLSPPKNTTNTTIAPPKPPPPKIPTLTITSPADGDVITATDNTSDVTLSVATQNLILQSPGGKAVPGEGFMEVTVDNGQPMDVTSKDYDISALPLGNHTISVQLFNNDRTPYSPSIIQAVSFSIEQSAPPSYVSQNYTVTIAPSASGLTGTEVYSPSDLTVKVGDSVTWLNNGNIPQSATCSQNGKIIFDTKTLGPGNSATITFNSIMDCDYYSSLFRAMQGHISVVSNGSS